MGICVQRYIKYLKCHSYSRNFFRKKSKKDRCEGTQERKQMFENKERAEKQLLTVNSVNPSCSSALKLYSVASIFAKLLPQDTIVIEKNRKSFIQNEQFLENLSFRMNTFDQNLSFRMNRFRFYSASNFSAIALPSASHCAFTSGVIACFISTGSPTAS